MLALVGAVAETDLTVRYETLGAWIELARGLRGRARPSCTTASP